MNSKKLTIIIVTILILLLGAWFGGSWYATQTAEERLQRFVDEKGLADKVSWNKVSATPLKTVNISGLEIADQLFVDELQIKDFENESNQQRIDLRAIGIKDQRGYAPDWLLFGWGAKSGMINTAPADLNFKADLNYSTGNGLINVEFAAKDFLQGNGSLSISNIYSLKTLLQAVENSGFKNNTFGIFGLLGSIENIQFNQLDIDFKDLGMLRRYIVLKQRYDGVPLPSNQDDEAMLKAYQQKMDKAVNECAQAPIVQNDREACVKIVEVLKGEKSSLKGSIKCVKSISLGEFLMKGLNNGKSNSIRLEID
ncbi:hypothetical protein V757_10420 [Pelistega indica]|uniref:DUF945 family protein n=1 Tax=Pelistega indica TaxID=1414851 RepID=V8FVJ6_9BURK|nr:MULTISPECIES: hypothetical protein [Pelistega]ETD68175.1 hypothetical protein V757_10420 [Pelistega indica]